MKKLLGITLILISTTANAGWWDNAKEKASSAMDSVTEATSDAYEGTKNYINENKDDWLDSGKALYEKSKDMVSGDDNKE